MQERKRKVLVKYVSLIKLMFVEYILCFWVGVVKNIKDFKMEYIVFIYNI